MRCIEDNYSKLKGNYSNYKKNLPLRQQMKNKKEINMEICHNAVRAI